MKRRTAANYSIMNTPVFKLCLHFGVYFSAAMMAMAGSYKVKAGDSLWGIAIEHKVSVELIQQANNLTDSNLKIGQVLKIPAPQVDSPRVVEVQDAMAPLPAVPSFQPSAGSPKPKRASNKASGLDALDEKQRGAVIQPIILDRAGMGPGIIDGYPGSFTQTATELGEKYRPNATMGDDPLVIEVTVPEAVLYYLNPTLPGTGKHPNFKQASKEQCLMMYASAKELLAERYHCSEKLLEKMNPQVDFSDLTVGESLLVPHVEAFKIEDYLTPEGDAVTPSFQAGDQQATLVDMDYKNNRLFVLRGEGDQASSFEVLASFPLTTVITKQPKQQSLVSPYILGPAFHGKESGIRLKSGPNSALGVMQTILGDPKDGLVIHGTADSSGKGYVTSSACIRMSNWDMVNFMKLVPAQTKINFLAR